MSWSTSAKLQAAAAIVGAGLVATFALGRPEPLVVVAPLAVVTLAQLAMRQTPTVHVECSLSDTRVVEGDQVVLRIDVLPERHPATLELAVVLPEGLGASLEERTLGTSCAGGPSSLSVRLDAHRWGSYRLGEVQVRVTAPLGLRVAEARKAPAEVLEVLPGADTLRRLVRPVESRATAGNQLARTRDRGLELADIRPFAPGDLRRDINWRATARHGSLHVNMSHPDRSSDVVVLVDAFSDATLSAAVRAASSLARAYLRDRDRVGLVSMGGFMQWLRPGAGLRQEYLVVQTLLQARVFANVAEKGIDQLPPDVLPRKGMLVALSPIEDERFRRLLVDVKTRGMDLVTIEVSPERIVAPAAGGQGLAAHRLWSLRRDVVRHQLRELGIPVVVWHPGTPLAPLVEEVAAWPRVVHGYR